MNLRDLLNAEIKGPKNSINQIELERQEDIREKMNDWNEREFSPEFYAEVKRGLDVIKKFGIQMKGNYEQA